MSNKITPPPTASTADVWSHCPKSLDLSQQIQKQISDKDMGRICHNVCADVLKAVIHGHCRDPTKMVSALTSDPDIQATTVAYVNYISENYQFIKKTCRDPYIIVEHSLDYSTWIPCGHGIVDCALISDDVVHIVDLKFGLKAVPPAKENAQLKCYALGVLNIFGCLYQAKNFKLTIFQPRLGKEDTVIISPEELYSWANEQKQRLVADEREFNVGTHCLMCEARPTCRAYVSNILQIGKHINTDAHVLTDDEVVTLFPFVESLQKWSESFISYSVQRALNGVDFPNHKLVNGRIKRSYRDKEEIASMVSECGFDPYKQELKNFTEMKAMMGETAFNAVIAPKLEIEKSAPKLVSVNDRRPKLALQEYKNWRNLE